MKFLESIADKFWGPMVSEYRATSRAVAAIDIAHFRGDKHEVVLTLQEHVKRRLKGPKRARKPHLQGYLVSWECVEGIPVRNDTWLGDCTYEAWFSIKNSANWYEEAIKSVHQQITRARINSNFDYGRHLKS